MATSTFDPAISKMHEAAEMAVFRLYGFLGAGCRLVRALDALSGTIAYVTSPYDDRLAVFQVSVLDRSNDSPLLLRVVHAPDYASVHKLDGIREDTPGHWVASLEAVGIGRPFKLVALTVEGQDLDLNLAQHVQSPELR